MEEVEPLEAYVLYYSFSVAAPAAFTGPDPPSTLFMSRGFLLFCLCALRQENLPHNSRDAYCVLLSFCVLFCSEIESMKN